MHSTAVRYVTHLQLTLVGTSSDIRREILVDRNLTLADLRRVVQTVFDWPACRHHVFTRSLERSGWSRQRRRWGDTSTMIDFRDPTVVDESTARIDAVLAGREPVYLAHTCNAAWVVEISVMGDDVAAATDPPVRILSGEGRSPFACVRGPFEHDVLVGVLTDPDDPDHRALRARVEAAVGPWATFAPESFDLEEAQRALDAPVVRNPASRWSAAPLDRLEQRLPALARAGFRAHLAAAGLDLPAIVTAEDAAAMTRPFRWVIERSGSGGVALVDGAVDPAVVREGADALGCGEDEIRRLYAAARRLRLVYARSGRLIAKRSAIAAAASPTLLWSTLADALPSAGYNDPEARDLLFLAISDGSLADPLVGISDVARAYAVMHPWSWDDGRTWTDEDRYEYPECEQHCDCPRVNGTTWHNAVAQTIRDAAASAADEGAMTVAAHSGYDDALDAGVATDWIDAASWSSRFVNTRSRGVAAGEDPQDTASAMLRATADLIELLTLFGLSRADDGAWIVPAMLREFARAALRRGSRARASVY